MGNPIKFKDEDLEQIIQAKIPFVSGIAISEKVRRKFQK